VVAHLIQARFDKMATGSLILTTLARIFFSYVGLYIILKFFNMPIPYSNNNGTLGLKSQLPIF
jgi:hypothetical protein